MSYPYLFYKFGGEQDFKRAREFEEALKQAGLEPPGDFYDELLEVAKNYGSADYLGGLYSYAVEAVRSKAENMGLEVTYAYAYPNSIASTGTVTIAELDDIDKDRETLENFLETLRKFKEKISPLEDWLNLGVEGYSLDEYIEKLEQEIEELDEEDEGMEI